MNRPSNERQPKLGLTPSKNTLFCVVLGAIWIVVSVYLAIAIGDFLHFLSPAQVYAAWAFILVTAALLCLLIHRYNDLSRRYAPALRETEERIQDVTCAASDWIWETDEQFRFTYCSDRLYELTGIVPAALLGRRCWALDRVAADEEKWRQHRAALEDHAPFRDVVYTHTLAHRTYHFKLSGEPRFGTHGQFKGYRGTGTDITEHVETQCALRESQRFLATLLSNLPGMAYRCRVGPDRSMEFASRGAMELTGHSASVLMGDNPCTFGEMIRPIDRDHAWRQIEAAAQAHQPYQVSYRIVTAHGQEKWVREQGRGAFSADGKLVALEGFIKDITDQKRADQEVVRMRCYLENLIDAMSSVMIGVDAQTRVTEWNQQAEIMTGIARDQARGNPFDKLFPPFSAQREHLKLAIRRHQPVKNAKTLMEVNGNIRYIDVMIYPLVGSGDSKAVIRMDDITTRVRIEEMMLQSEKMLSLGGLAAGMAHEINNPLTTIMQSSQNILRRFSPKLRKNQEIAEAVGVDLDLIGEYLRRRKIPRFVNDLREAGTRSIKIVDDMLSFSRRGDARHKYIDLEETLETALRLAANDYDLKKKYNFRQIRIEKDFDPELGHIPGDRTEIEQVILNLLKNSAQAMAGAPDPKPTPRITLRTRKEPPYARIEVSDNGPGMDEKTRNRVFEPFFTTKKAGIGTGLGLSVSFFIITERHRGTLDLESLPNQGARFIIRLPLTHEHGTRTRH